LVNQTIVVDLGFMIQGL